MLSVKKAKYLGEYKIALVFSNNNKQAIVDLYATMFDDHRKIFQELRDVDKFKQFVVKMDTLVWRNGLDLASEYLYEKCLL